MSKKYTDVASASPLTGAEQWGVARSGVDKYQTNAMLWAYLHPRARLDNDVAPFNNIAITTATTTALTMDHLAYDTGSFYSAGQPTRLTAPATGLYLITGQVRWASTSGAGIRRMVITLNGSIDIAFSDDGITTHTNNVYHNLAILYLMTAADYVQLRVNQTSGGNLNIQQTDHSPVFSIVRMG